MWRVKSGQIESPLGSFQALLHTYIQDRQIYDLRKVRV